MNMYEVEKFLFNNLPYSISVLEEWEKNKQQLSLRIVCKQSHYIAVRNERFEWLCYVESSDYLDELLEQMRMKAKKKNYRIIVYSKEMIKIEDLKVKNIDYHIWLENFMVCKLAQEGVGVLVSATKGDINELARLQRDYCLEEINWSHYHTSLDTYKEEYKKKIQTGIIFLEGSPIKAKVELSPIYGRYSKVNSVYTKPDFRKQGLSAKCINQALIWAAKRSIMLCLNVREDNASAIHVYKKAGFSKEGVALYMKPKN